RAVSPGLAYVLVDRSFHLIDLTAPAPPDAVARRRRPADPAIAAPRLPPAPAPGASSRWPPVALGSDRVPPPREFGEEAAASLIARRWVEAQLASDCRDVGLDGLLCVSQPLHNDCTAALTR